MFLEFQLQQRLHYSLERYLFNCDLDKEDTIFKVLSELKRGEKEKGIVSLSFSKSDKEHVLLALGNTIGELESRILDKNTKMSSQLSLKNSPPRFNRDGEDLLRYELDKFNFESLRDLIAWGG